MRMPEKGFIHAHLAMRFDGNPVFYAEKILDVLK
jgi:hypothetical protein